MAMVAAQDLKLKNTFLHIDDALFVDDMDQVIDQHLPIPRRQASEPTPPKSQLSSVGRDNAARATAMLGSYFENDDGSESDDFGKEEIGFNAKRQMSDFSEAGGPMGRQGSAGTPMGRQESKGFDRQTSAFGFCRQETSEQWPTYQEQYKPQKAMQEQQHSQNTKPVVSKNDLPNPQAEGWDMAPGSDSQEDSMQADYMPNGSPAPVMVPMPNMGTNMGANMPMLGNPYIAALAMNNMLWQNMIAQGMNGMDYGAFKDESTYEKKPMMKNRRKATSLITLAKEAQQRQQQLDLARQHMILPHTNMSKCAEQASAKASECKFCPHCAGEIKKHFKFCQLCGQSLGVLADL